MTKEYHSAQIHAIYGNPIVNDSASLFDKYIKPACTVIPCTLTTAAIVKTKYKITLCAERTSCLYKKPINPDSTPNKSMTNDD
ncbi:hypothetical protein D3C86_1950100 [compost metagenome]